MKNDDTADLIDARDDTTDLIDERGLKKMVSE